MRKSRILAKEGEDGLYHCMSRCVGGMHLLGSKDREMLLKVMWKVADFLCISILDYALMSNHYHQLVAVPGRVELSDMELLEKLHKYYGSGHAKVRAFEKAMQLGGESMERERSRHLRRMGNLAEFEKTFKQSFSRWYNRTHNRLGTLWMERYKSVLVEDSVEYRRLVAAYIDLNPVRAELVQDPKNYRHCGYAAAVAGDKRCQRGLMRVMGMTDWKETSSAYRLYIMHRGAFGVEGKKGAIGIAEYKEALLQKGELSDRQILLCRVRYLSDGLALGGELFVDGVFERYRTHFGKKRKTGARSIRGFANKKAKVLRDLRVNPIS